MTEWKDLTKDWPDFASPYGVLIFTDGVDFGGEQYFIIDAEDLYSPSPCEEVEAATHWAYLIPPGEKK